MALSHLSPDHPIAYTSNLTIAHLQPIIFTFLYIYFLEDMSNYKSYYQYPRHNIIVIP